MISKVVSGAQTGVDRAALDAALALGIPCAGWCPQGRLAEDGAVDERYPLQETPSRAYEQRTEWNVRDSDGTLILKQGLLTGCTAKTVEFARHQSKPCLIVDLADSPDPQAVRAWISANRVRTLNVAGPRESVRPGIYAQALAFLEELFGSGV